MSSSCSRDKLLEAAGEVFAEKGFKDSTVREICSHAGVNLASVNYYFGDKKQLYIEALKLSHPGRINVVEKTYPKDAPAAQRLRAFVRVFLERLAKESDSSWKVRLFRREVIDPTPFCREMFREYFRQRFSVLEEIIADVLPPELPDWRRRQVCFSIVGQCVYFRAARNVVSMVIGEDEYKEHYTAEMLADHIVGFSLSALGLAKPLADAATQQKEEVGT